MSGGEILALLSVPLMHYPVFRLLLNIFFPWEDSVCVEVDSEDHPQYCSECWGDLSTVNCLFDALPCD